MQVVKNNHVQEATFKRAGIIDYILRQRENGYRNSQIREHMELTGAHTPEMLNIYFGMVDKVVMRRQAVKVAVPVTYTVSIETKATDGENAKLDVPVSGFTVPQSAMETIIIGL